MPDTIAPAPVSFGYNAPAADRGIEPVDPVTFVRDLQGVCDIACQAFDTFWVSDHLGRGDRFRMECWTQMTWLAARYPSQTVGSIVMANSFRRPSLLAKMTASLQHFSRGRVVLGYGAGWAEEEYRAYGYEFPSTRVRIAQMVEGIQVIRALWTSGPASFDGRYYQVRDACCEPGPEPAPPIMIGGDGERYLLRAVAEHADWWLGFSRDVATMERKLSVLRRHCLDVGRDYESIEKVCPLTVYLAETRSAAERMAGDALERTDEPPFAGDPAALIDHLQRLVELGFRRFALVFAGFPHTADIRLFVDRVLPAFR
jgi:alkanesulfonate monooxygenase SsuD/methylene tetrahydromethanopterin reductase-like flavin-dependent oxidoreductase (luciferase family)